MVDDRFEEGEVGRHAADAELAQRAVHAGDRLLRRRRPGGDLLQQRIVEAGDDRAGIGGAAVEPDAEAGRAAIGGDAAIVGDEVLLGVLGGDAALQRVAVQPDVLLRRHAGFRRADRKTVEDVDLRLDDVDAGDLLGHRVLDLDARIDLDEVEFAGVGVLQELDRAGADIVGLVRELQRIAAEFLAQRLAEIGRRRALDDLLVAALDRAVALEQMHGVAMGVAEHLHLDMAGALDQLFEIDLVLAEGGLGLALALGHLAREVGFAADGAHAAAAAAPGRLQHHRIADFGGELLHRLQVVGQRIGRRDDRHADLDGEVARRDLVAEPAHRLRLRADEGDAGGRAGLGEFRAFRQQPVAGMDRVGARQPGDADHLLDRQIAFDRPHVAVEMRPAPDLIALVGLEAVQRIFVLLRPDARPSSGRARWPRGRRGWRFRNGWRRGSWRWARTRSGQAEKVRRFMISGKMLQCNQICAGRLNRFRCAGDSRKTKNARRFPAGRLRCDWLRSLLAARRCTCRRRPSSTRT